MMTKITYSGCRFPPEIIQLAIRLYLRFALSFRDVEDLLWNAESDTVTLPDGARTNCEARQVHAAVTTSRLICTAESSKARCVLAM